MICPIVQLGDPILWEKCLSVSDFLNQNTQNCIENLRDTLADFRARTGFGRGIAASQIGVLERIIYIKMPNNIFEGALINPIITSFSTEKMILWDDCFSFPEILIRVERAQKISVKYQNPLGEHCILEAEGAFSELLQHEIDHLDGILAIDRALSPRDFCKRSEWEKRYKGQ